MMAFKMCSGDRRKRRVVWKPVKCAKHSGEVECGYFIMKYMYDIVTTCFEATDIDQVICTKCDQVSNQYENMMDLTVEIQGDATSLQECLDQFTAKEWLDGENMYKCDGFRSHENDIGMKEEEYFLERGCKYSS